MQILLPNHSKTLNLSQSPINSASPKNKKFVSNVFNVPTTKLASGNQKLNFNKNLDNLTPRSKALFFSLCKQPTAKQLTSNIKNKPHASVTSPHMLIQQGSSLTNQRGSMIDMNNISPNKTEGTPNNQNQMDIKVFDKAGEEAQKLIVIKLNIKEVQDVIRLDINNIAEGKISSKNYMKDLPKYSKLLATRINSKSPRTRQALINLAYDPDDFPFLSFEEMYNPNMGRIGNIRKYMEYLTGKSNDFLSVIGEKNRLMTLERDLNKKFINENIISKNFSDSIFHVNTFKLSEQEMENIYYNYYTSPESRKHLNICQREFDTKILVNRNKFINYKKKIDFVQTSVEKEAKNQSNYYESWEEKMTRIEKNKIKEIDANKKKSLDYIEKVKNKQKQIKKMEGDKMKILEQKAQNLIKQLTEEQINKEKLELQRYFELGMKDKLNEEALNKEENEKRKKKIKDFHEITEKLEDYEKKNRKIHSRKTHKLNELKEKLKNDERRAFDRNRQVKTLQDQGQDDQLQIFLDKYKQQYERTLSRKEKNLSKRVVSAHKREREAFKNLKFNVEKLRKNYGDKKLGYVSKLEKDDEKSEKSAELKKKKVEKILEKTEVLEKIVKKNYDQGINNLQKQKTKILDSHKKIEMTNLRKSIENEIILNDLRQKNLEKTHFKQDLLTKSL